MTVFRYMLGLILCALPLCWNCGHHPVVHVAGDHSTWHTITLTFDGPACSEDGSPNPYTDYRLTVDFINGGQINSVPGYFAADGNAAETSATAGNKWRVHFVPDKPGAWTYQVSFRTGAGVAVALDEEAGQPVAFDGSRGTIIIGAADEQDPFRRGMLQYVGRRYLQWAGTGDWFIKGGADAPENFLGYADFDGTYDIPAEGKPGEATAMDFLHRYEPHLQDWKAGDPVWRNDKGKGIIGALNYLASKGMNSVYFLPMNVTGDGNDTWPWIDPEIRDRYDCSKLDQWEIVFSHMDRLGLMLHIVTSEKENYNLLDGGDLGILRRLYYRELIARFAHHRALIWNIGEENGNSTEQRKDFCAYIKALNPYRHPIVLHTNSTLEQHEKHYAPLLGFEQFDGAAMQIREDTWVHNSIRLWIDRSRDAGHPWVVTFDEQRTGATGVQPDDMDPHHDADRNMEMYATLFAGGAGIEWYFGYLWPHNDLTCEDWRSRDNLWTQTKIALDFMHEHLPFTEMEGHDNLTPMENDYVFAKPGEVYAIYLPKGGTARLNLEANTGAYTVRWFNPRSGGTLATGSVQRIIGGGPQMLGNPPKDPGKDWVILIRKE